MKDPKENLSQVIASNNINKMNEQIDKAVSCGDFAYAFNVINSIPTHFDDYSRFFFNPKTDEIGTGKKHSVKCTLENDCCKAVTVLKAESDILLSKDEAKELIVNYAND